MLSSHVEKNFEPLSFISLDIALGDPVIAQIAANQQTAILSTYHRLSPLVLSCLPSSFPIQKLGTLSSFQKKNPQAFMTLLNILKDKEAMDDDYRYCIDDPLLLGRSMYFLTSIHGENVVTEKDCWVALDKAVKMDDSIMLQQKSMLEQQKLFERFEQ